MKSNTTKLIERLKAGDFTEEHRDYVVKIGELYMWVANGAFFVGVSPNRMEVGERGKRPNLLTKLALYRAYRIGLKKVRPDYPLTLTFEELAAKGLTSNDSQEISD